MEKVRNETPITVPEVEATSFDEKGLDFFLMEKLDGQNFEQREKHLSRSEIESLMFESGKLLARMHEETSFEDFGQLDGNLRPEKVSWREKFRGDMDWRIKNLEDTEFSDLRPEVEKLVEENIDVLDGVDGSLSCA